MGSQGSWAVPNAEGGAFAQGAAVFATARGHRHVQGLKVDAEDFLVPSGSFQDKGSFGHALDRNRLQLDLASGSGDEESAGGFHSSSLPQGVGCG
jgi:hypothetical protein